ncbi:MAG: endolytic transglycosylase MltG [Alphaproteobacteria bacterium]|nr:endolytic transglycosylase MltG [Alphaproteobacteria bacterium]
MQRWAWRVTIACLLLVLYALIGLGGLAREFHRPGPAIAAITLVVPAGSGARAIAAALRDAVVLRRAWAFLAAAAWFGVADKLKAGEYRFPAALTPRDALAMLVAGQTLVRRITVPEGLTVRQIIALLEAAEGLVGEVAPTPEEGSLLPDIYGYSRGESRAALLRRMNQAMRQALDELWPQRQEGLPFSDPREALTLASIVEKETARPSERAVVAGVFVNRLRRGMRLQADPTVAYAVSQCQGTMSRPLARADLDHPSPYNTYVVPGLPPGPIANPGREAIAAALRPAPVRYLYFVADGQGGHAFAESYAEHRQNVERWRRLNQD